MLLTPQVCPTPALTETKEPAGGLAWPYSSLPQQATEPSTLTPQLCSAPALTETKEPAGIVGRGLGVGRGVDVARGVGEGLGVSVGPGVGVGYGVAVGYGVGVGRGVFVGTGVEVGHGVFVGRGVALGIGVGLGAEVVKVAATFASTVASIAVSASRVPRIPASTVAGMSDVGRDAVCVSAGDGSSLVQATAVRPKITKTIRMIILIFFFQCRENFQSSLSTGSAADYETNG